MPPKKTLYFLPFLALLLLGGVMGTRLLAAKEGAVNTPVVSTKPAPSLTGVMYPENSTAFTEANFKGQYTVVNFFASWCAPCLVEFPLLKKLQATNATVVGIAFQDPPARLKTLFAKNENPFQHIILDEKGTIGINWGINGLPATFLINPEGHIVWQYLGELGEKQVIEIEKHLLQ
jgi:cytochrome c biogenesis protein CcmG/thiol:disulfide interchange protein DsbE